MANVGYRIETDSAVALTATTARTVIGVKAHANSGLQVVSYGVSMDGNAAGTGVFVEFCYCTFGANAPGTNSTTTNAVNQIYGRSLTAGFTGGYAWTTEPTTITRLKPYYIQQSGAYEWATPLGKEPDCALAEGFCLRLTSPTGLTPNVRAFIDVERI